MKKALIYIAVALVCLSVFSCSKDNIIDQSDIIYCPGDKINFTATAVAKIGNKSAKDSRTIYGKVNDQHNSIELNWVIGDEVDIACNEAKDTKLATYKIPNNTDDDKRETILECISSKEGLQWSDDNTKHNFYASYPSNQTYQKYELIYTQKEERPFLKVKVDAQTAQVTGFMPRNFEVNENNISCSVEKEGGKRVYTIAPNMDFAYMVANHSVSMSDVNNGRGNLILDFFPLATALEFDITANDIYNKDTKSSIPTEFTLERVEFLSTNQNITGNFTYDFNSKELKNNSGEKLPCNELDFYLDNIQAKEKKITMKKGDVCNVTAFLIPSKNFDPSTLKVRVWYRVGKTLRYKTASVGEEIKYRYKYYFKNFTMPAIKPEPIYSSEWFYIKYVKSDKYLTANWPGSPLFLDKETGAHNQMWKFIGYKSGNSLEGFSFRIKGRNIDRGAYAVVSHGLYEEGKNNCPGVSDGSRPDYFVFHKTKADGYVDKEGYYELMYDYSDIDDKHYKDKCLKDFGDNSGQYRLGLGQKDCEDNVIQLIPVENANE